MAHSISYGNFSGLADAESSFPSSNTASSLYSSNGSNNTINISSDNAAYRIPRYNNLNTQSRAQNNPNSNTFSTSSTAGGMFSYGNCYTRSAAIANTFAYNGANSRGSMAQYWTSTTRDAQQNYYFDISTSSYYFIYPGTYPISAYTGLSIRCVYFHPLQF